MIKMSNQKPRPRPNGMILNFFKTYDKVITGLGVILGIIGLSFTYCQIRDTKTQISQTKTQIRETKVQIRENTSYQIHKDGREKFKSIANETIDYITATDPKKSFGENTIKDGKSKIQEILMYYASLYKQYEFDNINKKAWIVISKEICNFLHFDKVKELWKERIEDSKMWNPKFIKFGNQCK